MNIILLLSQLSTNACVNRLLVELNESKALIRDKQAKLDDVVRDVSDRDTAIQQLESMFESTTHRYSENKRRHKAYTQDGNSSYFSNDKCFLPRRLLAVTS